jgi:hypothetical protein
VYGLVGRGGKLEIPSPEIEAGGSEPWLTFEIALERFPDPSPEEPPSKVVVCEP